jgi:hypothetical protein
MKSNLLFPCKEFKTKQRLEIYIKEVAKIRAKSVEFIAVYMNFVCDVRWCRLLFCVALFAVTCHAFTRHCTQRSAK